MEVPKFQDNFFDIIYIDGNHNPEFVLEDAVLSFRKLKQGGVMIFDDYGWGGPDLTQRGIDAFLSGYRDKITRIRDVREMQLFITPFNISNADYKLTEMFVYILNMFALYIFI